MFWFSRVNAAGGIPGQKIERLTLDDGCDVPRAVANAHALLEQSVIALFKNRAPTQALMPLPAQAGFALVGPSAGAMVLHQPVNQWIFTVRATYQREAERAPTSPRSAPPGWRQTPGRAVWGLGHGGRGRHDVPACGGLHRPAADLVEHHIRRMHQTARAAVTRPHRQSGPPTRALMGHLHGQASQESGPGPGRQGIEPCHARRLGCRSHPDRRPQTRWHTSNPHQSGGRTGRTGQGRPGRSGLGLAQPGAHGPGLRRPAHPRRTGQMPPLSSAPGQLSPPVHPGCPAGSPC
jgi:hypothetical protein